MNQKGNGLIILMLFVLFVVLIIGGNYVAMLLWNWLDREIFHWHQIGFWHMAALAFIVRYITYTPTASKKE